MRQRIGKAELYHESDDKYLEINDELYFLEDGSFVMLSDRDGWNHLYHVAAKWKDQTSNHHGDFNVTRLMDWTLQNPLLPELPSAAQPNAMSTAFALTGVPKALLTEEKGTHNASFTDDFSLFVNSFSAEGVPTGLL